MLCRFRLSKLGKHWVLSLMAGFLVLFVSLFVVNLKIIALMKADKIQEHSETITSVQRSVDRYMLTLKQLVIELMLNNQNMTLQAAPGKADFVTSATYSFSELLYNIKMANAFVEDVYLYYPTQDYVVGTRGSYFSKGYFLLSNNLTDIGYSSWREDILLSEQTGFFFYAAVPGEMKLYLRQQMYMGADAGHSSVLVICVDGTEFARLLNMTRPRDRSTSVAVFNIANELYQVAQDTVHPSMQEVLPLFNGTESTSQEIQNGSFIGWRTPSSYGSFYYVVVSDLAVLLASITQVQHLLIAAILLCTAVGVSFSLFLSWKHHAPIEKTLRLLDSAHGGARMDYYEFEQRINELIRENENAARLNGKMLWSLKKGVLTDILSQRLADSGIIGNLLQTSGITLDYVYYSLLLLDVSFEKDENRICHWLFRAGDVFERECGSVDVVPTLMGGTAMFLLNYETSGQSHVLRLREIFLIECQTEAAARQSDEFITIDQLVSIYEQTLIRLRGQMGADDSAKELAAVQNMEGVLLLERWQKALRLREYASAGEMIPALFEKYIAVTEPYVSMSRRYTVINTALQYVETEDARQHTALAPKHLQAIKNCTDTPELPQCLREMLCQLEQHNNQYASKQKDKLACKIKKIIETNYNQPYLGLYYISDQVKVSTTYVSKVFKKEYGLGIVEYMNRLRIDGAKKLMESQNLTIKEIAEKIGFTSDIHFIRIFKKYEHTTPGVYQKKEDSKKC